jgi:hypothetical protein
MRNGYLLIGIAALLIGSVMGGGIVLNELYKVIAPDTCEDFLRLSDYIWLPGSVSDLFLGDIVILHFSMHDDNVITGHGTVSEGMITDLGCGRADVHDFEVWMSDANALQLATSEKPITTFVALWRRGDIRIEASSVENEMKLAHADMLMAKDDEPVPEGIRDAFSVFID